MFNLNEFIFFITFYIIFFIRIYVRHSGKTYPNCFEFFYFFENRILINMIKPINMTKLYIIWYLYKIFFFIFKKVFEKFN